uniref:F-box domain-containing protein n=2 Tax=Caenorhabditis tropicalis TaxID=1561998 RepID=A0A1I7T2H3_9PELO
MSLSKQERPEDRLSALDFIRGHLKIGISKPRPQLCLNLLERKNQLGNNIKKLFKSRIGKPLEKKMAEEVFVKEGEDCEEDQFRWLELPDHLREIIVHKMPLQSRVNLAATSKGEREFVKQMKVKCSLFVIEDLSRRATNLLRYPDLHWKVFAKPGKRFFLNFVCDWNQDIAICFCEERRPFYETSQASKVYWLTPGGSIKKTVIPNISSYDLAVQTAKHFFSIITEDCKRSSVALSGWPEQIFQIPELQKSLIIGSSFDDVQSIHKTFDFFEPYSFDVYMHKIAIKYILPFSILSVARHGLRNWMTMRENDRILCDQMLDKDIRILILHDSFVSQEKINSFIGKWSRGEISKNFCWFAISTHLDIEIEEVIDQLPIVFAGEKFGPKYVIPKESKKKQDPIPLIRMVKYDVLSLISKEIVGTLYIRDKMVLFANAGSCPSIDEFGLITYKTRSGLNRTQF